MNETCGQCNAYDETNPQTKNGLCRAKPPRPLFMGFGTNVSGQRVPLVDGFLPIVARATPRCRDSFQPRSAEQEPIDLALVEGTA